MKEILNIIHKVAKNIDKQKKKLKIFVQPDSNGAWDSQATTAIPKMRAERLMRTRY